MLPVISDDFMMCNNAAEIWAAVKKMYSKQHNIFELYKIEAHLHELKQGNFAVHKYYALLTNARQQMDTFETHQWSCITYSGLYKEIT